MFTLKWNELKTHKNQCVESHSYYKMINTKTNKIQLSLQTTNLRLIWLKQRDFSNMIYKWWMTTKDVSAVDRALTSPL